jgi:hypothetical protein
MMESVRSNKKKTVHVSESEKEEESSEEISKEPQGQTMQSQVKNSISKQTESKITVTKPLPLVPPTAPPIEEESHGKNLLTDCIGDCNTVLST